jgi:hypothetical protein
VRSSSRGRVDSSVATRRGLVAIRRACLELLAVRAAAGEVASGRRTTWRRRRGRSPCPDALEHLVAFPPHLWVSAKLPQPRLRLLPQRAAPPSRRRRSSAPACERDGVLPAPCRCGDLARLRLRLRASPPSAFDFAVSSSASALSRSASAFRSTTNFTASALTRSAFFALSARWSICSAASARPQEDVDLLPADREVPTAAGGTRCRAGNDAINPSDVGIYGPALVTTNRDRKRNVEKIPRHVLSEVAQLLLRFRRHGRRLAPARYGRFAVGHLRGV